MLKSALDRQEREYRINPGDGAFYGPKIDFHVTDALGRSWQLGTCQLDFQMPERFELNFTDADDDRRRPVMIHRALLGSMERFAGILIEHYAGRFPAWLAPVQAIDPAGLRPPQRLRAESRRGPACRRGPGRGRRALRVGRQARSATPSSAATRTCWSSATARTRPGRSRSAPTSRVSSARWTADKFCMLLDTIARSPFRRLIEPIQHSVRLNLTLALS